MGKQVPFAILAETSDAKYRSWAMAMDFVLWYIFLKKESLIFPFLKSFFPF